MKQQIRQLLFLTGKNGLVRWALLVAIACGVGIMELIAALLIFVLMSTITSPGGGLQLPMIGDIRSLFSGLNDEEFLITISISVAAFFIVRAGVSILQAYLQNRLTQNAGVRLATRLLHGYLHMPYVFHLRRNSSQLIRNVHNSVHQIVSFGFLPSVVLASEALMVIAIFAALLLISPAGTLLTIVSVGPPLMLLIQGIKRIMRRLGHINQEASRSTLQALQETFQGIRDIRVLGRESFFEWKFAENRAHLARALYGRGVLVELPRVTTEALLVTFIVVFLVIAILVDRSLDASLGLLGVFAYAGIRLIPSANRIVANLNNLQFARAAVEEVHSELVLCEQQPHVPQVQDRLLPFNSQLVVKDLRFEYEPNVPVLKGLNLTIHRGEWIGVIGSTGSGKSTLVDVLLGLLEPVHGSILVDGLPIHNRLRSWQAQVGIVPQHTFLIDDTLRRNIAFGLSESEVNEARLLSAARLAQLESFISSLEDGLDTIVGERGFRLSGGQRQRVAIARALYREPDVLFFDEATSALDNLTEARIIEALAALHGTQTMIMVAHRVSTLSRCDRIIVLESGQIVDSGSYGALLKRNQLFQQAR